MDNCDRDRASLARQQSLGLSGLEMQNTPNYIEGLHRRIDTLEFKLDKILKGMESQNDNKI